MDADVRQALRVVARSGDVGFTQLMEMFPRLKHEGPGVGDRFGDQLARYKIETEDDWQHWSHKIPEISFPTGWKIRIIPPIAGATIRFVANGISVYLDCHGRLDCMDDPYWEIYPAEDGDTERYDMLDTEGLLDGLRRAMKL